MWEVGKETIESTWDCCKLWHSKTGMLSFSWPLCSLLLCSGALLGNIFSPGVPRNGRPHSCFTVLSLYMWQVLSCGYPAAGMRKQPDLWSEIPFRNTAIVWHCGAMTGRVLAWVIGFISTWFHCSKTYSYNSLNLY